jgi:hypothetical protein
MLPRTAAIPANPRIAKKRNKTSMIMKRLSSPIASQETTTGFAPYMSGLYFCDNFLMEVHSLFGRDFFRQLFVYLYTQSVDSSQPLEVYAKLLLPGHKIKPLRVT